jgi:hypothetical protein
MLPASGNAVLWEIYDEICRVQYTVQSQTRLSPAVLLQETHQSIRVTNVLGFLFNTMCLNCNKRVSYLHESFRHFYTSPDLPMSPWLLQIYHDTLPKLSTSTTYDAKRCTAWPVCWLALRCSDTWHESPLFNFMLFPSPGSGTTATECPISLVANW